MKRFAWRGLLAIFCLVLLPAVVSAAVPRPQGALVYTDDFSDPTKSKLDDNVNATDYSRGFHSPGVYHLRLLQENDTRWSLFPGQVYGALTYEVDLWDNSDDFNGDVSQGVVIRATDFTHFYALLLDSRMGRYALRKLNGEGNWSDIVAWTNSDLIKQQAEVNHLRVDAVGDTINVYLNDQALTNAKDSSYPRGGLGFIASNVDASKPHIHFDNVKIYTTEASTQSLPGAGHPLNTLLLALTAISLILIGIATRHRQRQPGRRDRL